MDVTMYDRLVLFNMLYYLAVIRLVASGFSNVYNEISAEYAEYKLIYNITISKYASYKIILVRTLLKSMCSMLVTYISIVCITILLGLNYSYYNYFQLFMQLLIGSIMLFGMGFVFCGLCNLFGIDKQIAAIFEFLLIIFMVIVPLENKYVPINLVKSNMYGILYNDIMLNEISELGAIENLVAIMWTVIILVVGVCAYNFTNYLKIKRGWKIYERQA